MEIMWVVMLKVAMQMVTSDMQVAIFLLQRMKEFIQIRLATKKNISILFGQMTISSLDKRLLIIMCLARFIKQNLVL